MRGLRQLLVATLVFAGCGVASAPDVRELDSARLAVGAAADPPAAGDPAWQTVHLPDVWYMARRAADTEGWYRVTFTRRGASTEPWAVLLSWVEVEAAVRVNGTPLGGEETFGAPQGLRLNAPSLVVVPAALLRDGENVLEVRLRVDLAAPGGLGPLAVGPASALRATYGWQRFVQVIFLGCVGLAALALGVINGIIYWRRDPGGARRWLALGTGVWSIAILTGLVRSPPVSLRLWDWLGAAALATVALAFMKGFHVAGGIERPGLERALVAVQVAFGAAVLLVPELWSFAAIIVWMVAVVALGAYVLYLVVRVSRSRQVRYPVPLTVASTLAALFVVHDVASAFRGGPIVGIWLAVYGMSVIVLYSGAVNALEFAGALGEAERLNRELEQRVRDKHAELERNYEALRALERERAVASERERIMRDMHDGMGGQLVSTLAMVESGRATPRAVADALRDALDDLRLVIDSLDPVEGDLGAALGLVRHRLEPRLERNGIRFDWRVQDLPAIADLGPERVLQVLRVAQEAIANVVKHAGAATVTLATGAAALDGRSGVYVEVSDDGSGFDVAAAGTGGRGLANMRRRAAALGGEVNVRSHAGGGTAVRLWIPLAPLGA